MNNDKQLFRFQPVNDNHAVNGSSVLINHLAGKAIDVPKSSFDKGEQIKTWEVTKDFNQRWTLKKWGKGVLIKSLLTGMCLDIEGESTKPGTKIIQWEETGGTNQQWIPEWHNTSYKFRSVHEPSLLLAIYKDDVDDGAKLIVTDNDSPTANWDIDGAKP